MYKAVLSRQATKDLKKIQVKSLDITGFFKHQHQSSGSDIPDNINNRNN